MVPPPSPSSPNGDEPRPEAEGPGRRRRWGRGLLLSLFALGVFLGGVGAVLVKSRPGQRLVLDVALDRVRGMLAGDLTVEEIHSSSLLGGATLVGVALDAGDGRDFLTADSIRIRYSILSLFGPVPRLAAVDAFGPRVVISRYPGEDQPNVARLMAPREPMPDSARGRGISLGTVRIVEGRLQVLTPVEGDVPEGVPAVPSPVGEGMLRSLSLDGLTLEVDDTRLGGPEGDLVRGHLVELAADIFVLERPVRITHVDGDLQYGTQGLQVDSATVRLPGSVLGGRLSLGPGGPEGGPWRFLLDLATQGPGALADLAWLDARIPDGTFRGGVSVSAAEVLSVELDDVRVELEASRLSLDGGIRLDNGFVLDNLEVRASPLVVSRLNPWLERDFPVDGWLSGNVVLSGRAAALSTQGRMTLVPSGLGGEPTTADIRGTLHLGPNLGATNLHAVLDPLNLELVRAFQPSLGTDGQGRLTLDASGRVREGVRFVADFSHGAGAEASRILARGSARHPEGQPWVMDVQGDLSPLALDLLDQIAPSFTSVGGVSGSVRAVGPLTDLRLTGDLAVARGRVSLDARADVTDLARAYRLDATLNDVWVSQILDALPEPSRWTGHVQFEGRGLTPDSLELQGSATALASRLGGLHLDSLSSRLRISDGALTVDTLSGRVGGFHVEGTGGVGLVEGAQGQARIAFDTDDLVGLRPLFMGDTVIARDTLSVLERQFLQFQGVDADSLPELDEVAMSGSLDGIVTLTGTLSALGLDGEMNLRNGVYGSDSVGVAHVRVSARDVTRPQRQVDLTVEASDVMALEHSLTQLAADLRLEGRSGEGSVSARQVSGERYEVAGAFALDSVGGGGSVRLDQVLVDVDSVAWHLSRPTRVQWDTASVTLDSLEVTREGTDPMSLRAVGTLAWVGQSSLKVRADGLHLDRVAKVLQREDLAIGGHLDLNLDVTGTGRDPVIQGDFRIEEPRYGDMDLSTLAGEVSYEAREAHVSLGALDGDRRVLRAGGTIPVDLALRPQGRRVLSRPMDLRVEADSVDAALVLTPLSFLEDVEGVVSGNFQIQGALDRPEPSGVLRLYGAAWSMEALGVRHRDVTGSLTLNPNRTVDVVLDGRASGSSRVRGNVVLEPLSDPSLDLTIAFDGFEAVDRRDLEGLMSGEVRLLGSYRQPRVEGALSVDRGTLYLDEFARSSEVVDLTDPRIFQVVDTTALESRPFLAGLRSNPFLQNLRVDVDLSVPRDTWLRSEDMNVEIGGDLLVRYDRLNRDVVMVGELEALRGSYNVMGRRFDVEGGSVGFIGTPGINPTLNIQAVSKVRRAERETLDVNATVEGTLTQPRVTFSSDEQGLAQSDLVSYLIFGVPSYELATGNEVGLQGAAGSVLGAARGAGVTYLSGTIGTRLGAALSQEVSWLDYLSISQAGDYGVAAGTLSGALAGTQVEVGQYVGKVFFVLIFRPIADQSTNQDFFGGARVEVALTDDYNLQGFWEDRFLRSRVGGFGDLGIQASQVVGVFIFREWGY